MPPKKKKGDEPERMPLLGRATNNVGIGIVGLPNVGKSTFFNTLSKLHVPAENYPFCTKEPNLAKVPVPDQRFNKLCKAFKPKSEVASVLTVTDIAGLVKGASEGRGLGNAFLSHIRAVDAVYHMVRAFEDKNVTHVEESVDPIRDMEIIENELLLKDVETVKKGLQPLERLCSRNNGSKEQQFTYATLNKVLAHVEAGKEVRFGKWTGKEIPIINEYFFLTAKPMIYLVNLRHTSFVKKRSNWLPKIIERVKAKDPEALIIPLSASFEEAAIDAEFGGAEAIAQFKKDNDNVASVLPQIIKAGYKILRLINYFTAGADEVRAWSIREGTLAPGAAGVIHTDFEKGFICADQYAFKDWKKAGADADAEKKVKSAGQLKTQGKNYEVQSGDILHFKFNT
jgi:obg-like ATPase 1